MKVEGRKQKSEGKHKTPRTKHNAPRTKHKALPMFIRNRIIDFRRVRAAELRAHPQNWRVHPPAQRKALEQVLGEIGYADALVARQCADGSLELIDGHLRAETTPDAEVPVLVVDLDEREAALLLAVHDPISAMADTDVGLLERVVATVEADSQYVRGILGDLVAQPAIVAEATAPGRSPRLDELFQIVVDCRDEADQRTLYESLTADGRKCRLVML